MDNGADVESARQVELWHTSDVPNKRVAAQLRLEYQQATEDCVLFLPRDRALVQLSGPDCLEWLQGQATNDVRPLAKGQGVSFCLCSPTGQIEAVVNAFAEGEALLLSTDLECRDVLLRRVETMVIMEEVEAQDLTADLQPAWLLGPAGLAEARRLDGGYAFSPIPELAEVWLREPDQKRRLLAELPRIGEIMRDLWLLEHGIPRWGLDIGPKTLPPELGPDFERRHVSYTKGCYTGQEVLQRIHSRGHTNKTWVGLTGEGPLEGKVRYEGREVGEVSSHGLSPKLGFIAAATVRNEAAEAGAIVTVGDFEASVQSMPLL